VLRGSREERRIQPSLERLCGDPDRIGKQPIGLSTYANVKVDRREKRRVKSLDAFVAGCVTSPAKLAE